MMSEVTSERPSAASDAARPVPPFEESPEPAAADSTVPPVPSMSPAAAVTSAPPLSSVNPFSIKAASSSMAASDYAMKQPTDVHKMPFFPPDRPELSQPVMTPVVNPYDVAPNMNSVPAAAQQSDVNIAFDGSYSSDPSSMFHTKQHHDSSNNVWSWIKGSVAGSEFLSKVAEKAKDSVGKVITTLDPQMKGYMAQDGAVDVMAAVTDAGIYNALKTGLSFGLPYSSVIMAPAANPTDFPALSFTFESALKTAGSRLAATRQLSMFPPSMLAVSLEEVLLEVTKDSWFHFDCLYLEDQERNIHLYTISQSIPVPTNIVSLIKEHSGSFDPNEASNLSFDRALLQLGYSSDEWFEKWHGLSQRDIVRNAAIVLGRMYSARTAQY
ncbi:unnamed protein product [Soboliphyme baturini]|uniref:Protein PRRC1 n=1 Tax=Soboliphyme baturini TaxID=241478 RepID=A0A183IRG2_9BILA|nr:unnamed protein product [Soboliphyme baturini]